jgi:hypothetical protein
MGGVGFWRFLIKISDFGECLKMESVDKVMGAL